MIGSERKGAQVMPGEAKAPFRANHVGSLLRPPELRQARDKGERGEISAAQLRQVEDRCILEAVKMQEDVGMQGITDGEFRRTLWHAAFLSQIGGVNVVEGLLPESARNFQNPDADVQRSRRNLSSRVNYNTLMGSRRKISGF
jgi:5-methyltetrahydropteroyltriglutamate--homocysteine methyltransferase